MVEVVADDLPDDDADAGASGDAPDDIVAEAGEAEAQIGDEVALTPGAAAAATAPLGLLPGELEARARADLSKDVSAARLVALSDAAASLRGIDDGAAELLENRLYTLQRKQKDLSRASAIWLRGRALQRKDEEAAARAAAAAEDRERDRLAVELRVAKAQEAAARSAASGEREETKRTVAKLRLEQDLMRRETTYERQRCELLRRSFVDWKLGQAKDWFQHPADGPERRRACADHLHSLRGKFADITPAPAPWSPKDRDGYLEITPGSLLSFGKRKKGEVEFASEALARRLYSGRHPAEATSAKSVVYRATALLQECLPGFKEYFPPFMLITCTLREHQGNLDLALFEVLWRFSHAVERAHFPHGLVAWPLPIAEMRAFLTAQGREELAVRETPPKPAAAAAASASGSAELSAGPKAGGGASSSSSSGTGVLAEAAKAASAAFAKAVAAGVKHPPPARAKPPLAHPLRIDRPPRPKPAAKGLAGKWEEPP